MIILLIIAAVIFFIIPFFDGWTGKYKHAKYYGVTYSPIQEDEPDEPDEKEVLKEIQKEEKLNILDQTIVKYNKLLDTLAALYENETDEKKKAALLKQQISTLEKLNRALEKLEKLDQ